MRWSKDGRQVALGVSSFLDIPSSLMRMLSYSTFDSIWTDSAYGVGFVSPAQSSCICDWTCNYIFVHIRPHRVSAQAFSIFSPFSHHSQSLLETRSPHYSTRSNCHLLRSQDYRGGPRRLDCFKVSKLALPIANLLRKINGLAHGTWTLVHWKRCHPVLETVPCI